VTDPNNDLVNAVDQLRKSVDQLRNELVRKDVFDQVLRNITDRFKNHDDDITDLRAVLKQQDADRKADRRLLIASFVGPFVMLLIGLYIAAQVGGNPT
jgi:hypothetical protein